jgi:hypothetical protein
LLPSRRRSCKPRSTLSILSQLLLPA